jgi:hypothetical protein
MKRLIAIALMILLACGALSLSLGQWRVGERPRLLAGELGDIDPSEDDGSKGRSGRSSPLLMS